MACIASIKTCPFRLTFNNQQRSFEWSLLTDNVLKIVAQSLFLIALTSQWLFGYYVASYYENIALQDTRMISNTNLINMHVIKADDKKYSAIE